VIPKQGSAVGVPVKHLQFSEIPGIVASPRSGSYRKTVNSFFTEVSRKFRRQTASQAVTTEFSRDPEFSQISDLFAEQNCWRNVEPRFNF
jgi:hypothetical protein